jgi:hypothetical protein
MPFCSEEVILGQYFWVVQKYVGTSTDEKNHSRSERLTDQHSYVRRIFAKKNHIHDTQQSSFSAFSGQNQCILTIVNASSAVYCLRKVRDELFEASDFKSSAFCFLFVPPPLDDVFVNHDRSDEKKIACYVMRLLMPMTAIETRLHPRDFLHTL